MRGVPNSFELRRVREIEAICRAAPEARTMQGLADGAGITYARLYNLLKAMGDEGEQIRDLVILKWARRRP